MKSMYTKKVFSQPLKGTTVVKGRAMIESPIIDKRFMSVEVIGMSQCNFESGEAFDEKVGIKLAMIRAEKMAVARERVELAKLLKQINQHKNELDARKAVLNAKESLIIDALKVE